MSINIYKDQMEYAELFGKSVLYTTQDIPRETVPQGWYCSAGSVTPKVKFNNFYLITPPQGGGSQYK